MAKLRRSYDLFLSGRGIALYHRLLKHSQYWSHDKLIEFQLMRLKQLLIEAYEKIDYYRKQFQELAFNPKKDFNDISDIKRIPILKQADARLSNNNLVDRTKLYKAIELRTSGTTGEPFVIFASPFHWIVEQGITWRHWKWIGYQFRDKWAIVRSYVPKEGDPIWKIDRLRNFLYLSAYHISESNINLYVSKLNEWKPNFLRGYPSSLYLLAKFMKMKSLMIDPPKAILTASETLLPQFRKVIEETFRAPIFDWYGLAEPAITMSECNAHQGLHINMEYGLCELISDSCLPKDQRRIVATSLHNDVMPLIRYETNDIAILNSESKCSCGRQLPLVKRIIGRSDDFLIGSEMRILPSVNFYTLFFNFPEIAGFQIIQNTINNIELRLVYWRPLGENKRLEMINELKNRFGPAINIHLVENQGFIQVGEGKRPVIIQKVKYIDI